MKVWIVFKGAEEDSWVLSVHRSKETAEAAMERAKAQELRELGPHLYLHGYWVDEQEVLP